MWWCGLSWGVVNVWVIHVVVVNVGIVVVVVVVMGVVGVVVMIVVESFFIN